MRASVVALSAALASPAIAEPARIDITSESVVGLSGIEVSADGGAFLAVSDRGWFVDGILRREAGVLVEGEIVDVAPIPGLDGRPVAARRVGDWSDAEGLALASDGTLYVSFERWARVARHEGRSAPAGYIKDHSLFRSFADNRQLEALAVDPGGRVFAFPEGPLDGAFPVFRLDPDGWTVAGSLTVSDGYSPVGADFAVDGTLYLLERKLVFATWFRSRLSRLGEDWSRRTVWESAPGEFGNLEGVSVWEAEDGRRAVMVSDDNGRADVPTEIVEIGLTD